MNYRTPENVRKVQHCISIDAECEFCGRIIGKNARDVRVNEEQKKRVIVFCDSECKLEWIKNAQKEC